MSTNGKTDAQRGDEESFEQYVRSQLVTYETRIEALEDAVADREERIAELEARVDELDSRTDLLQFVERSDELDGTQRSAALLQYLYEEAEDSDGTAAVTKEKAKIVLHHPDIDRTTYYSDFKRVRDWVDDPDVCWYESKTGGNTRLMLDLTEGEIGDTARNKITRK